uniref:Uncharacterized protein n=1 Tax=Romanomermis culicivorax TaxID=13658 RepID=A0A915HWG7_ROMCU
MISITVYHQISYPFLFFGHYKKCQYSNVSDSQRAHPDNYRQFVELEINLRLEYILELMPRPE